MRILIQNREGKLIERDIQPGTKLVGLRLLELTFESRDELEKCLTEEGIRWLKHAISFRTYKE
jgi:hypothetical protein